VLCWLLANPSSRRAWRPRCGDVGVPRLGSQGRFAQPNGARPARAGPQAPAAPSVQLRPRASSTSQGIPDARVALELRGLLRAPLDFRSNLRTRRGFTPYQYPAGRRESARARLGLVLPNHDNDPLAAAWPRGASE